MSSLMTDGIPYEKPRLLDVEQPLKSCPWCKNEVQAVRDFATCDGALLWEDWHIYHRCKMFGPMKSGKFDTEADAIAAWNRRANG